MPVLHASHGRRPRATDLLALAALAATTAVAAEPATPPTAAPSADELAARLSAVEAALAHQRAPAAPLHLTDLSLVVLGAAGGSTATDDELPGLQGGGHDPSRRGFTFQGAELSIAGAVDPYFRAETHLVAVRDEPSGETGIELEEAYVRSTALSGGLELKLGLYLLEFGRFNPTHPHAWQFIDQPLVLTRVFGGDGQRTPGARLAWNLPLPWLSEALIGVADANGETAPSFLSNDEEGAVGGWNGAGHGTRSAVDLLWHARWSNAVDVADTSVKSGLSGAVGPNRAGGRTTLYGADLAARWHPAGGERGWPFVLVESEYIGRAYRVPETALVDGGGTATGSAAAGTLGDHGVVLQGVWGFTPGWAVGLRGERAWSRGRGIASDDAGDQQRADAADDPRRDQRTRASALLSWQPSEFAHFRLQYAQDRAAHLPDPVHSVWLGAEFLIGTHPAHAF